MTAVAALAFFCLLIGGSIYLRACRFRNAENIESRSSPLAAALQEMVATAGGIYLSLVMLISFLKIELPNTVLLQGIAVDPTALLSIGLAIIQPLFFRLFYK